ncbi:hypothetical protein [Luteococcus sp.]|uniref:hypothetical protein n=1 Tax=Luteococcus sp. TaxID=1969402 RepID=UPI003735124A
MNPITQALIHTQLALNEALTKAPAKRDERGSGSVEQLGWIAIAIAVIALVTTGVIAFIKSKMPA